MVRLQLFCYFYHWRANRCQIYCTADASSNWTALTQTLTDLTLIHNEKTFLIFISTLFKFSFFSFLLLSFLDHIYHQINSPWLYFLGLCNTCINRFVLYSFLFIPFFIFYFIYTVRDFAICLAFSQDEPALRKNFTSQTRSRSTPDWTPYKSLCLSLPFDVFYRRDDIKWVEHMPLSTHNALSKCRWKNTNDIHTKGNLVSIQ